MEDRIKDRIKELEGELKAGQERKERCLKDIENLDETMLRIQGALTVLRELLDEKK